MKERTLYYWAREYASGIKEIDQCDRNTFSEYAEVQEEQDGNSVDDAS